jgi:hypothetical protein
MHKGALKVALCPLKAEDFSPSHTYDRGNEKGSPHRLYAPKFAKNSSDLGRFQNFRFYSTLPDLPDMRKWAPITVEKSRVEVTLGVSPYRKNIVSLGKNT